MDKELHERASALFLAACERPEPEREVFLAGACAGDSALLDEVRALLAAHARLTGFLEKPALGSEFEIAELSRPSARASMGGDSRGTGGAGDDDAALPERLGSYRVLGLLGRGGMGAVYLAEQEHPQRRVALKIVPPGIATPAALRRFTHEAELLGRLQHPGIAQVYEAGTAVTALGPQPFFALELVRGLPLTVHAREKRLDLRGRMSLFERVCQAVQHAHNRGVIHRDLKPANILVDESGQPKILDFGVARAIDADVQAGSLATRAGEVVGTLAYMSPEQVEGDSAHIDVRTDVYALGVILYELLAERLPLDLSHATLAEGARRIREDEPTPLGASNPALRGDVETIAARALEKDRDRRYASAGDLAADVQRFLNDEPILARPASTVYQLSKFARRHRGLVSGLAAAFAALVFGIAGTIWQAVRATEQRNAALTAKEQAQQEAARAQAGYDFVARMLGSPDPSKQGREIRVVDLLHRAELEIDNARDYSRQERAYLYQMLGTSYLGLGLWKETEPLARKALQLMQEDGDDVDAQTLVAMANLGVALHMLGRCDEAEPLLTQAVSDSARILGPDHDSTLDRMTLMVQLRQSQRRFPEALQYAEQVVMQRRRAGTANPQGLARSLSALGNLKKDLGRFDEAEVLHREAIALHQQVHGVGHAFQLAYFQRNLATCLIALDKLDEADSLIAQALESHGGVLSERHPSILNLMSSRASLQIKQGRLDEARRTLERVVPLKSELLGEVHEETLVSRADLGSVLLRQGQLDDARAVYESMLEGGLRDLGADHDTTLAVKLNLADLLQRQGEYVRAEQLRREVSEVHRQRWGRAAEATMLNEYRLADVLLRQGKLAEAESLYLDLFERSETAFGAKDWRRDLFVMGVATCQGGQGCRESSAIMLLGAFTRLDAQVGLEHESTQRCLSGLVQAYEQCNEWEKAAEFRCRLLQAD